MYRYVHQLAQQVVSGIAVNRSETENAERRVFQVKTVQIREGFNRMIPARQHIFRAAGEHRFSLLAGFDVIEIAGRIQAEQKRARAEVVKLEFIAERAERFNDIAGARRQPVQLSQNMAFIVPQRPKIMGRDAEDVVGARFNRIFGLR